MAYPPVSPLPCAGEIPTSQVPRLLVSFLLPYRPYMGPILTGIQTVSSLFVAACERYIYTGGCVVAGL